MIVGSLGLLRRLAIASAIIAGRIRIRIRIRRIFVLDLALLLLVLFAVELVLSQDLSPRLAAMVDDGVQIGPR